MEKFWGVISVLSEKHTLKIVVLSKQLSVTDFAENIYTAWNKYKGYAV